MSVELKEIAIVVIALAVVIIGAAIIYGRSLVRTGRERKELHRRRVEEEERKETFKASPEASLGFIARFKPEVTPPRGIAPALASRTDDDTTQILPGREP